MNEFILNIEIQEFIKNNLNSSTSKLLFKKSPFPNVDSKELVEQIEAKKKCESKLPSWFNTPNIYYPNKMNIEQTSSELTANYKSKLVSGKKLIDITGGFGVDSYYFSKQVETVDHCEMNVELSGIAKHNFEQFKARNINTISIDGLEFLENTKDYYDWIYVDPSRRHDVKGKVFLLSDCLPDIPNHLDFLFEKTNNLMIKTSPLLDISNGIDSLKNVKEIHCVAVNNEMKELLWILEKDFCEEINVQTINITNNGNQTFAFNLEEEKQSIPNFSVPEVYLYEPNTAILKSGAFNVLGYKLGLNKLHPHSHLYTNNVLLAHFPGRIFKIEFYETYSKKSMAQFRNSKANITTRNFPESVASIKKKYKINDGGDIYLFFTTLENGTKVVLICSKTIND